MELHREMIRMNTLRECGGKVRQWPSDRGGSLGLVITTGLISLAWRPCKRVTGGDERGAHRAEGDTLLYELNSWTRMIYRAQTFRVVISRWNPGEDRVRRADRASRVAWLVAIIRGTLTRLSSSMHCRVRGVFRVTSFIMIVIEARGETVSPGEWLGRD